MKRKIITKKDIWIFAALLSLAVAAVFVPQLFADGGRRAVVIYNGEPVLALELDKLDAVQTYTFASVEVEIGPDGARVVKSDCKDQICVRSGLLTKNGDTAACVPEKVVLKIVSEKTAQDVDAVVY